MVANNNNSGYVRRCKIPAVLAIMFANAVLANDAVNGTPVTSTIASSSAEQKADVYGPILKTDTLWKIAVAHRPDTSVSNYQVMMALFNANPKAFLRNDINTMIEGQYLRIPSIAEIRQVAPYPYGEKNKQTPQVTDAGETPVRSDVVATQQSPSTPDTVTAEPLETSVSNGQLANSEALPVSGDIDLRDSILANEQKAKADEAKGSQVSESETDNQDLSAADAEQTASEEQQPSTQPEPSVAQSNIDETTLASENEELKSSLSAVDDQLSYLQYEVAKASEMQELMDRKLAEQQKLLEQTKRREQQLLAEQRKLAEQKQGFFSNPMVIWSSNLILLVLVGVLFFLISRRKKMNQVSLIS
ncbi:FimV/HubP family polar landmark protein [Thalassotalea ponticola]|uniref:FimV/HubP family polar landmark protein n=1 Tax=Thalassotalea ponticola TaxID=1523392 RepID=UPI003528A2B5